MKELVSIIIPIYNSEKTLERCMNSVLEQTYSNIEVVCINDGSLDNSWKILKQYAQLDKRIKIINKDNEGVSKARNKGLKICSGEYLLFVDADDYISSDMIENLYLAIKEDYDIAISGYTELNGNCSMEIYDYKNCNTKEEFLLSCIQNTGGVVCSKLYRTSLIKRNNIIFDETLTLSEDLIFALQVFLKAERFIAIEKADYYYDRRHEKKSKVDVEERLNQNLMVHEMIREVLENENIINKQRILNKRLESILYANLYTLVQNRDYDSFAQLRHHVKRYMKNLIFNEYDMLNKVWLKLYRNNFVKISYWMCSFRVSLVQLIKESQKKR